MAKTATRLRGKSRTHALWLMVAMFGLACGPVGDAIAREDAASPARFTLRQIGNNWTLVDPRGRPFYSLGIAAVDMKGNPDRKGANLYAAAIKDKYDTPADWAAVQQRRFANWGINTIGAFSDTSEFARRGMPYTVLIRTTDPTSDLWSPEWEQKARSEINRVAALHRNNPALVGYFIDNELPWGADLSASLRPGNPDALLMGRYFQNQSGRAVLVAFLKGRYARPAELRRDFPSAQITGHSWNDLDFGRVRLGEEVTEAGKDTLDAWAAKMAERYFSVTAGELKRADPEHLSFGHKFTAFTPREVVRIAGRYADVMTVDVYEFTRFGQKTAPAAGTGGKRLEKVIYWYNWWLEQTERYPSTENMLAEWTALTGKPVLIGEFGYRAMDAGLPNSFPPLIALVPTQSDRRAAIANYARCAINAPHIVGIHYFQLIDQSPAGRTQDGENSNWGLLNSLDLPYREATQALREASRLAARRTSPTYRAQPCTPISAVMLP